MTTKLYDVVAVSLPPQQPIVRLIAQSKTIENALAIVTNAVMRQGVDEEFFVEVPEGAYKEGDVWTGWEAIKEVSDGL